MNAPALPFESTAVGSSVSEREIALGASRPNPKRGAMVVAAVAVLLVGGGLIAGAGAGDDDDQQANPTPSTTAERPSTTERPTRTTVRRTTTTSVAPTYSAQPISELGGLPVYAVVNERAVRIDPATGQSLVLGDGWQLADGASLMPRAGGVVVSTDADWFFPDDGSRRVPLARGEIWPAADPALLWQRESVDHVALIRAATGEEVLRVGLPAFSNPAGDDGTGRLLVTTDAGDAFTIDALTGAPARLSDASVLTVTATHVLQLRCSDALACGHELVDRATGAASAVTLSGEASVLFDVNGRGITFLGWYLLDATATTLAVFDFGPRGPHISLVDLSTGAKVEISQPDAMTFGFGGVPANWTPDGQHLVTAGPSSIAVWTPGSEAPAEYAVTDAAGRPASITAAAVGF